MANDDLYLTPHEAALAVVATAMKKSRLRLDTLVINSFVGGILFSSGGMLYVMAQAECPQLFQDNPGIVRLIQGLLYPIGLFYVVVMGMDLFNANVLYFSTGVCRGAVSIIDLAISWLVSWWFNLVGNIFVAYIICNYSDVTRQPQYITGSIEVVMSKAEFSFVQTMIKGIAGNFFAALAIYLQLMAKPIHVKFLMMGVPVFTFVALGFTHSVADMYMLVIGLINGAPISVGTVAWKIFLPGAIGNVIGGSFFGIVITWYLHLVVVERDQQKLDLPKYDVRDEQPELNMDSRVVISRTKSRSELEEEPLMEKEEEGTDTYMPDFRRLSELSRVNSRVTGFSTRTFSRQRKSPRNVFPVAGMGAPLDRERSIASGRTGPSDDDNSSLNMDPNFEEDTSAEYIGDHIKRVLSRRRSNSSRLGTRPTDAEAQLGSRRQSSASIRPMNTTNANHLFKVTQENKVVPISFLKPPSQEMKRSRSDSSAIAPTAVPSQWSALETVSSGDGKASSANQSENNSSYNIQAYRPDNSGTPSLPVSDQ